ncbi:YbfB/YjiJ family MFS transporter [Allosaccharopolyspora coralli]|uniref:YbfB/YjiJ family MFS transporter n=2 Tax=Allosaccharopolyspora coralli TaxID=2665642 RepID=A0A5Q3QEJ6_9PSEU|nr:YbfB/YjiJ family MFS transporter [Allosaccharopolyspora coralli]
MGVGRFVYTPILPLMQSQTGLDPEAGAHLATANYVGYLVGAVALSLAPGLTASRPLLRTSLVALVGSLALMPATGPSGWLLLRLVAGIASAVVFLAAVRVAVRATQNSPHRAGYAYAGVGSGIALSGLLVLLWGSSPWPFAWYSAAGCALVLFVPLWILHGRGEHTHSSTVAPATRTTDGNAYVLLLILYFLEGVGYIIAATFLVAALSDTGLAWLGNTTWILVGLAAAPSCVVWAYWSRRVPRPTLLVVALAVQTVAIALPGLTTQPAVVLLAALGFGGTFMGITTLTLGLGAELDLPRAAATLTAGYGFGQVLGPIVVQPTLGSGYRPALLIGGAIVFTATLLAVRLAVVTRTRQEAAA